MSRPGPSGGHARTRRRRRISERSPLSLVACASRRRRPSERPLPPLQQFNRTRYRRSSPLHFAVRNWLHAGRAPSFPVPRMAIRGPDRLETAAMPHAKARGEPTPPTAAERPQERHAHGVSWRDDYAWIRAENWREVLRDPAQAAGRHSRAAGGGERLRRRRFSAPTRALQRQLVREMRARLKEDDSEVPQSDGPYAYYSRFRHGGQHRIFCRRPREGGKETILLDGDERADGQAVLSPERRAPFARSRQSSPGAPTTRARRCTRSPCATSPAGVDLARPRGERHRRSSCGRAIRERLSLCRAGREPPPVARDAASPRHFPSDDVEVFEEADPAWFIAIAPTRLGRSAIISVHGHDASEARVVDLDDPAAPPLLIAPRRPGLRYEAMDHGDVFYIRTNGGGARDFKIVTAPRDAPRRGELAPVRRRTGPAG